MKKNSSQLWQPFRMIGKTYEHLSNWGKILVFVLLFLLVVALFKNFQKKTEGFQQQVEELVVKNDVHVYDDFYSDVYDYLVYNNIKDDYEIGEIINRTQPSSESVILDVGSATGHHVASLASKGFNVTGVDISDAMIRKAKQNYPHYNFVQGDVLNSMVFPSYTFTHIMCLYFTIYYFKNKNIFFENCMRWLLPGGYLMVHVVNPHMFDPILPPGNPLLLVSPQRYAKERITTTKVVFNDMHYSSDFQLPENGKVATFLETFKDKGTGKKRENKHTLYMDSEEDIVMMAQNAGFILTGKIDLLKCHYEYQYVYILQKPN